MTLEEFDGGTVVACVILGLSFVIGAPGNVLVIWTILRHVKQRSHTVVLILHLAVADLLVLITLPLWIYSLAHSWVFGEAFCKVLVYIINVCMFSSIFFITLMSVERYLAVCHPFLMMGQKTKTLMERSLIFLWLLAFLLGVPAVLSQSLSVTDAHDMQCLNKDVSSMTQAVVFICLETLVGFLIPFMILSVCYCLVAAQLRKIKYKSKKKSVFLIHAVVIAFAVCWLPYHVINVTETVCTLLDEERKCVSQIIIYGSGALVFLSSSVNPVLYVFFARNLQGSLQESRLVRLFKDMVSHTNTLRDVAVQHKTSQGAASTQVELTSDPAQLNTSNHDEGNM